MPAPCCDAGEIWLYYAFHYHPSEAAAWSVFALYGALTVVNLVRTLRLRRPASGFLYAITVTGIMEMVGYGTRVLAVQKKSFNVLVVTQLFIILPPIALAVVNYAMAGALLRGSGRSMGPLKAEHVARAFFTSDVLCLFIQGAGGAQMSKVSTVKQGMRVILFGLALQLLFYMAFLLVALRLRLDPAFGMARVRNGNALKRLMHGTIALLFLRNFYRVVEFASSDKPDSFVASSEKLFYCLEALPILLVMLAYTIWHPAALLPDDAELAASMAEPGQQQLAPGIGVAMTDVAPASK